MPLIVECLLPEDLSQRAFVNCDRFVNSLWRASTEMQFIHYISSLHYTASSGYSECFSLDCGIVAFYLSFNRWQSN